MFATSAVSTVSLTAAVLLAACSVGSQDPTSTLPASGKAQTQIARAIPDWLHVAEPPPFHRILAPDAAKTGIYVSAFYGRSIYGFKANDKKGHGPNCRVFTSKELVNGIAVDGKGNLIAPFGRHEQGIHVFKGPDMCGEELGVFRDPFGQPASAASFDAATGTVVIADLHGSKGAAAGNLALCTLKTGCTKELTNPNITGQAVGVALAKNGDCWLTSENAAFTAAAMTYWNGCTGPGQAVTGFKNSWYGSLSIDANGNLISLDAYGGTTGLLWVYSGCNPECKLVGGPFSLEDHAFYGALSANGKTFGATELYGEVDVYKYSPTKLTYKYSFSSGFNSSDAPEGFAYNPAFKL